MAVAALGTAACGAASNPVRAATTANAVSFAFSALRSQPGVKLTISLDVTPAQLAQMQSVDGGSGLSAAVASAVSGTSVVINVHTGRGESLKAASAKAAPDKNAQAELSISVKGSVPVDIRIVDQTVFLKADVSQLLSLFGQDSSAAGAVVGNLSELDSMVPGIAKLATGGWVSVSMKQFGALAGKLSKAGAAPGPSPLGSSFLKDIGTVFNHNASVVNQGTHGGRTEYRINAPVRQLAKDLISTLSKDAGSSAAALSSLTARLDASLASVPPDMQATVVLWVKDDRAQEIDIDLNQFDHRYASPVPLKVVIAPGAPVVVPGGATALDLSPLAGLLAPGLSGVGQPVGGVTG